MEPREVRSGGRGSAGWGICLFPFFDEGATGLIELGEVLGPLEGGTPVMEEPLGGFSAFRTGAAVARLVGVILLGGCGIGGWGSDR